MDKNEMGAIREMRRIIYGNWGTCVSYAFAELGFADILYHNPMSLESLAIKTKIEPKLLLRFLRCCNQLQFVDIAKETNEVKLTPFGEFMCSDHPLSQRDAARLNGAPYRYDPWGRLVDVLLSGDGGAFSPAHKSGSLDFLADKPEQLEVFQRAMTNLSVTDNEQIISAFDFKPYHHIVDIGGGHGTFIDAALTANPHLKGSLFDLPNTLATVDTGKLVNKDRLNLVPGDFFESVPDHGDVYVMKNILHNWPEDKVAKILGSTHKAMTNTAGPAKRLLIIEYLVPEENSDNVVTWLDLNFFILVGGSDRTLNEYKQLFSQCNFSLENLVHTASGRYIMEVAAIKK